MALRGPNCSLSITVRSPDNDLGSMLWCMARGQEAISGSQIASAWKEPSEVIFSSVPAVSKDSSN